MLTAYELDAAPPLRATPLRLVPSNGAAGAGLGARLWRETRLVREVRAASDDSASASAPRPAAPFETGAELFVPAPRALGDGAVLRVGHPGPATDALERAVSPDAVVGEDDDVAVTPEDDDDAYARVLREALYAHAIAVAADVFEVSRAGARGVVLTSRAGVSLDGGDASAARTFELAIRVPARPLPRSPPSSLPAAPSHLPPRPRVVIRVSHELRDSRTVRELMDDPSARAPPEGARATTLGGPKLDGAISYGNRAGTVGEPRPELGGDSLLEYHRKRYPARVALLERADPAAEAVWLTPLRAGASPMAYPAELLAVIGGRVPVPRRARTIDGPRRDAASRDGGSRASRATVRARRDLVGSNDAFALAEHGVERAARRARWRGRTRRRTRETAKVDERNPS